LKAPATQKSESPVGAGPIAANENGGSAPIVADDEATRKERARWFAKFALAGHSVHELAGCGFLVVHPGWGMARECPDFSALIAFARQIGVRE
jgi:hypothetical protein